MALVLQGNSPRLPLRPGPALERKGHARRGVSSGRACVRTCVRACVRAPPPGRARAPPGWPWQCLTTLLRTRARGTGGWGGGGCCASVLGQ